MPRVVPDQREKFDNDELFRKMSRESEVRYTGHMDKTISERQQCLRHDCQEGHANIAFVNTGINLPLQFESNSWSNRRDDRRPTTEYVDFTREPGKVHLKSQFILNGVCVVWRGWLDLCRLDGTARLEFDAERASIEDDALRQQIEEYNETVRRYQEYQIQQQELQPHHHHHHHQLQQQISTTTAPSDVVQALLDISSTPSRPPIDDPQ